MLAIGTRYVSSLVTGMAGINGLSGTFVNFTYKVPAQAANRSADGILKTQLQHFFKMGP
jgi:hypothetical protein